MSQLNATFGSGGMSCSFSDCQLTSFIHFIQRQCEPIPVKEAAMVIGRQPRGDMWVVNPAVQIDSTGKQISPDESRYVWLDQSQLNDKYSKCKVPKEDICTEIEELVSREGDLLSNLLTVLKACLAHNFTSALLMLGASVMTFHFSSICKKIWRV